MSISLVSDQKIAETSSKGNQEKGAVKIYAQIYLQAPAE